MTISVPFSELLQSLAGHRRDPIKRIAAAMNAFRQPLLPTQYARVCLWRHMLSDALRGICPDALVRLEYHA